jgi:hypothetical protein
VLQSRDLGSRCISLAYQSSPRCRYCFPRFRTCKSPSLLPSPQAKHKRGDDCQLQAYTASHCWYSPKLSLSYLLLHVRCLPYNPNFAPPLPTTTSTHNSLPAPPSIMPNKNKNRGQYHAYDPKDMERYTHPSQLHIPRPVADRQQTTQHSSPTKAEVQHVRQKPAPIQIQ